MKKLYEILVVHPAAKVGTCELTQEDWFQIFLTGVAGGNLRVIWLQPAGDESKRVTFAENQPDA